MPNTKDAIQLIILNIISITGDTIFPNKPVIHKIMNANCNILVLTVSHSFTLYGIIFLNIFSPSNGGNGIRLNTPRPILTVIAYPIIVNKINPTLVLTNLQKNFQLKNF